MLRHVSCNELRMCVFVACQDSHTHCYADLSRDLSSYDVCMFTAHEDDKL
jgi:hypothetical protein